jgi:hypothetical protein
MNMRPGAVLPTLVMTAALAACGDGGPLQNAVSSTSTTVPTETSSTDSDDTSGTAPETTERENGTDLEVAGVDFGILDLPPGDPYDDYTELVDDTGTIRVEVPRDWSDTDTAPTGAEQFPFMLAATAYDGFFSGWDSPGVFVVNQPTAQSEQAELDAQDERVDLTGTCEAMEAFDYDDGSYTGLAELWMGCGPDDAGELAISTFVGDDHLLAMVQLLTEADIDAATRIIETFSLTGG